MLGIALSMSTFNVILLEQIHEVSKLNSLVILLTGRYQRI